MTNRLKQRLIITLLLAATSASVHAAEGTGTFPAISPDYHDSPSFFSDMGGRALQLVGSTAQVFNRKLAHSISTSSFRMTPADLPAPENWDYEYWDYVKEPKSYVMPTMEGGLMFEVQIKY